MGEYRFVIARMQITPFFNLVDETGTIVEEAQSQPITIYPGKFLEMRDLVTKLEAKANAEKEDILRLATRPLL
jgi:hypothetical protein